MLSLLLLKTISTIYAASNLRTSQPGNLTTFFDWAVPNPADRSSDSVSVSLLCLEPTHVGSSVWTPFIHLDDWLILLAVYDILRRSWRSALEDKEPNFIHPSI